MDLPLSLFISLRFNYTHNRFSITSFISFIFSISISFSIAVLIIGLSIINGFEYELSNRILSVIPHGKIELINQPMNNWNEILKKIKNISGVVDAIPYVNFTGLIESKKNLSIVQVNGVDQEKEEHLNTFPKFVQDNAWINFKTGKQQIILGKGVADLLKVKKGDWISLSFFSEKNNHIDYHLKRFCLHVIGIFQLNSQLDHNFAMIPLEDAKSYLSIGNRITGIAIKTNRIFNAKKIVHNIKEIINNYNFYITSWTETYGYVHHDIQMIRTIMYSVMFFLIIIACFNISSILIMMLRDKRNDIAILISLGAENRLIYFILFWYSSTIWLISSFYGIIVGIFISLKLKLIINIIENVIGHQILSSNIYFIDFISSRLCWSDFIYILIIVFLLCFFSSFYPMSRIKYINPSTILNNY